MKKEKAGAYFTVEAALLYPVVLGVIVLMIYLLFFQYDRCLMEQDMGRAAVMSGGKWMMEKEEVNKQLLRRDMFFDREKYIAWETELPYWKLEGNHITVEQTGRLKYSFSALPGIPIYWSARASFRAERTNPVEQIRIRQRYFEKKEDTTGNADETEQDAE